MEELLQGAGSAGDLIEALTTHFEVDRATAERDVRELVAELGRHLVPEAD